MSHTLVTILGGRRQSGRNRKSKESAGGRYEETVYRFPDGTEDRTAFLGLALSRHLKPDVTVILGTCSSQWGVLVEHLAEGDDDEDARLRLFEAEDDGAVTQPLLDDVAPLMKRAVGCDVRPRLIPFGQDADEQYQILDAIADAAPKKGSVSFDLTHGFRHLGMVGFLSAFMLERVRNLLVRDLWYGAFEMKSDGITPVLKLDGLVRVRRWMDALDRFDATGDYGVFAKLLIDDGMPEDTANCLKDAAFHERTSNVRDAARSIDTFLPVLDGQLAGASHLFRRRLAERLQWVKKESLAEQERELAHQYLKRDDFVRAAILGLEACVTHVCERRRLSAGVLPDERQDAVEAFKKELKQGRHPKALTSAWWMLNGIRNALAHGTHEDPREDPHLSHDQKPNTKVMATLGDPSLLRRELRACMDRFFDLFN